MNANQARELMIRTAGFEFQVDSDNEAAVNICAAWLARDREVSIDLNKGLMLIGHVGTGKTELMRTVRAAMRDAYGTQFGIKSCGELVRMFTDDGYEPVEKWITAPHVCFDDLGTESTEAIHFGKRANLMKEVIEARYERMMSGVKCWTHITTNLGLDKIRDIYGERVASRLPHMCNIFGVGNSETAKDRRRGAAAPVHGSQVNADNIYGVVHPDVAARLGEAIAPLVEKIKADRVMPSMHVAHSAEADRQEFTQKCASMEQGELEAHRASYLKNYPMNTNGHSEAMKYVAIIDQELARIHNTQEVKEPMSNPAA